MTASELRDLMVRDIAKGHRGGAIRWRKAVGVLKVYPRETHGHCNWEVRPSGTPAEIDIVERAADLLRERHPFVEAD